MEGRLKYMATGRKMYKYGLRDTLCAINNYTRFEYRGVSAKKCDLPDCASLRTPKIANRNFFGGIAGGFSVFKDRSTQRSRSSRVQMLVLMLVPV